MAKQVQMVSQGFGFRLREERERVGMNQTELAEVAGIRRMAQGQYENEVRSPTVKYLSAVAGVGIDVHYLLFGSRCASATVGQRGLEKKAFELVEAYVHQQPDGQLGAEGRYAIFELIRAHLRQSVEEGRSSSYSPAELIAGLGSI